MPLMIPGSVIVGPRPTGGSEPADLPAYLTAIGKNSLYGGYRAGLAMYSSIDNSAPVTTDGASVRRWVANWTAGGWSAEFSQITGSRRPVYGTSRNGKAGIYGDGVEWYFTLSSTTALNLPHTVLMSTWSPYEAGGHVYSQNNNQMQFRSASAAANDPICTVAALSGSNVGKALETTPATSSAGYRTGFVSSGTGFYNTAPNLFRNSGSSAYTASTIHELWLIGAALTPREISKALQYLL